MIKNGVKGTAGLRLCVGVKRGLCGFLVTGLSILGSVEQAAAFGSAPGAALPSWARPVPPVVDGRLFYPFGSHVPRWRYQVAAHQFGRPTTPAWFPSRWPPNRGSSDLYMAPPRFAAPMPYAVGSPPARPGFRGSPAAAYPRLAGRLPARYAHAGRFVPAPYAYRGGFAPVFDPRRAGLVSVPYPRAAGFGREPFPSLGGMPPGYRIAAAPLVSAGRPLAPWLSPPRQLPTRSGPSERGRFQAGTYRFRPVPLRRIAQQVVRHNGRDWRFRPTPERVASVPLPGHLVQEFPPSIASASPLSPVSYRTHRLPSSLQNGLAVPPTGLGRPLLQSGQPRWTWRPVSDPASAVGTTAGPSGFTAPVDALGAPRFRYDYRVTSPSAG